MLAQTTGPMTLEAFLEWEARQEEKHELIDGVPVRRWDARMMAGGTNSHAVIAANLVVALAQRLRGAPCRAVGSDLKTESPTGAARYPDVTVDRGPLVRNSLLASEPRALFEVLSPSNGLRQQLRLLEDYQAIASAAHIVFVEQDRPSVLVWSRADDGSWARTELDGAQAVLDLPGIGVSLTLAEVYEGVELDQASEA